MAAKPPVRAIVDAVPHYVSRPPRRRIRHAGAIAIATATCFLTAASASLADTGAVYIDGHVNVGAGESFFNPTFTGAENVGLGFSVMPALTTGQSNVATGIDALAHTTTGYQNVGSGDAVLARNTSGHDNDAVGFEALFRNTSGRDDLATGTYSLFHNTTGHHNVGDGVRALAANTSGNDNTALGHVALAANRTGSANVAIGSSAGQDLTTGSDNVDIANPGVAGESGTIRIGGGSQTAAYLGGVSGTSVPGPTDPVVVNAQGRLGTSTTLSAKAQPLSAATGRRLLDQVKRLQGEVQRLRAKTRSGGWLQRR